MLYVYLQGYPKMLLKHESWPCLLCPQRSAHSSPFSLAQNFAVHISSNKHLQFDCCYFIMCISTSTGIALGLSVVSN